MKGSPILATILACLIMLGMYVGMRVAFSDPVEPVNTTLTDAPVSTTASSGQTSVYVEIYFSSKPEYFSITHPATAKVLVKAENLDSSEWSGDVIIPVEKLTSTDLEIQCQTHWSSTASGYNFMQIIISPDELDPQSKTLRAESDIVDLLTFHWEEDE